MTSLFTKVTLVPTLVTSTEGFTPLGVIVTVLTGGGVGTGVGLGDGATGVGDGLEGVPPEPQLAAPKAGKAKTRQEIAFAHSNRRPLSWARPFMPGITFAS
jgi:hypothetical protein